MFIGTIIYALMRQIVDKTALQTVSTDSTAFAADAVLAQPPLNTSRSEQQ